MGRLRRRILPVSCCALLAGALAACSEPVHDAARGPAGPEGPRHLVEALAALFGPVQREPAFQALRPKLSRSALTPSRIYDDRSALPLQDGEWRGVELVGYPSGSSYWIGTRGVAAEPLRVGEYREGVRLRRTAPGCFEWDLSEELAAGGLRPDDLALTFSGVLRELERQDATALRSDFAASLPRTTELLSALARVERLGLEHDAAGATQVALALRVTPDGLTALAPRYAAHLHRELDPLRFQALAKDDHGTLWWQLDAAANLWTLRLRVKNGSLVPLVGTAARGLPERFRVEGDYETKVGIFGVGLRRLVARVELVRTSTEKGFVAHFTDQPQWELPFLVAPLLRGSLTHPFENPGSEFGLSLRQRPGAPLLLAGHYRYRVRESWIVRWLGGAANNSVSDFRRRAEGESLRYNSRCLLALRDDVAALLPASSR